MYGPKWPFYSFLSVCGPDVVSVKCWDRLCILGRALRTKETLPDFHEWCRVTDIHECSAVDRLSTGPPGMGRHSLVSELRFINT